MIVIARGSGIQFGDLNSFRKEDGGIPGEEELEAYRQRVLRLLRGISVDLPSQIEHIKIRENGRPLARDYVFVSNP